MPVQSKAARRTAIGGLLILLLLSGAFLFLRFSLPKQVDAELAGIRQLGLPVSLVELDNWYAHPAGGNAALAYENAFQYFQTAQGNAPDLPVVGRARLPEPDEPLTAAMEDAIAAHLEANRQALELLHKAEASSGSRYSIDLSLGHNVLLPHLSRLKQGTQLLKLEAILAAEQGRTREAGESLLASARLAESLANEPILISWLVRIACIQITASSLEQVLNRHPLSADQLERLRSALILAEDSKLLVNALQGERCFGIEWFRKPSTFVAATNPNATTGAAVARQALLSVYKSSGLLDREFLVYLKAMKSFQSRAILPFPEAFEGTSDAEIFDEIKQRPVLHQISGTILPSFSNMINKQALVTASLRAVQAAIAVEQYRLKNSDQLPEQLADLVPAFLDEIPTDPFDGEPVRYRSFKDAYVVYSIGPDRSDNGGAKRKQGQPRSAYDLTFGVGKLASLHSAAKAGDVDMVRYRLDSGEGVDTRDQNKWTALHYAAGFDRRTVVEMLIVRGADVNSIVEENASERSGPYRMDPELMKRYGLVPGTIGVQEKEQPSGKTPLDLAIEHGHEGVAQLLREHGAKQWKNL